MASVVAGRLAIVASRLAIVVAGDSLLKMKCSTAVRSKLQHALARTKPLLMPT